MKRWLSERYFTFVDLLEFLRGAILALIYLNILIQWSELIIYVTYDTVFDTSVRLLSIFIYNNLVTKHVYLNLLIQWSEPITYVT